MSALADVKSYGRVRRLIFLNSPSVFSRAWPAVQARARQHADDPYTAWRQSRIASEPGIAPTVGNAPNEPNSPGAASDFLFYV
jgi:hypothetical protein